MKNFIALLFIASSLWSCAQTNKVVSKAQAFYTIPMPGTIAVDMQGKPLPVKRNKVYRVVAEVKSPSIVWTNAWADGKQFSIGAQPVEDKKVVVGKRKTDDSQITVEASKGATLLQLELSPIGTYKQPPQKIKSSEMLLQGKLKGKIFYYTISKITELASPEYQ